jgi:hypothetical protein
MTNCLPGNADVLVGFSSQCADADVGVSGTGVAYTSPL